jgi:hypothetical protein
MTDMRTHLNRGNIAARFFRRIPPTVYFGLAALVLLALIPLSIWATRQAAAQLDTAQQKTSTVASAAAAPISTVEELCARGDALAAELISQGKCASAAKAKQEIVSAPSAAPVPGLTISQVAGLIEDRVSNLPRPLTVDQVGAIAADIYSQSKPKDGENATPEMVAAAVTAFCAGGACTGKDAPPPTDGQVLAQVQAMCQARSDQCAGPKGDKGDQGPAGKSFQRQYFARDSGGLCRSYVETYDPATSMTSVTDSVAGDAACATIPEPTTPTTVTTGP